VLEIGSGMELKRYLKWQVMHGVEGMVIVAVAVVVVPLMMRG